MIFQLFFRPFFTPLCYLLLLLQGIPVLCDKPSWAHGNQTVQHVGTSSVCPQILSKQQWGGRAPLKVFYNILPIEYVIVHLWDNGTCNMQRECETIVQNIQSYHMNELKFDDIGYNFIIGGDGSIFEGVGWHRRGTHKYGYNYQSIGIALLKNNDNYAPTKKSTKSAKDLIECGIAIGELFKDVKIYASEQAPSIIYSGDHLFDDINSWSHWAPFFTPLCYLLLLLQGIPVLCDKPSWAQGNHGHGNPHANQHGNQAVQHVDTPSVCPQILSKQQWGGRAPLKVFYNILPIEYVIVHHTVSGTCNMQRKCETLVQNIQSYHMNELKLDDIGYNFIIGGDGSIFEGVGWHRRGSHTYGYNYRSIGIAFLGNYENYAPTKKSTQSAKDLIECGISIGELSKDVKIYAAKQVQSTLSPGEHLFDDIKTWPHWASEVKTEA
uniref:Putative peptidoglycan recognition protein 3-like polistes canadensis n=1 Tax=Lutzomyia longipalpis TaxID=7200 RepID=A0A1B0CDM4_LUTLO